MTVLQEVTKAILEAWNAELARHGTDQIKLDVGCKMKTFYVSKENTYETKIAELKLLKIGEKETLLLWRKEYRLPPKVKNEPEYKIEQAFVESLYKALIYEAIGLFTISCEQLIKSKDYAPYDIVKDRLVADPEFDGIVIKTKDNSEWYEEGNTFDVFTKIEDGWAVYTAHDAWRGNNGIAKITFDKVDIVEANGKDVSVPMSETGKAIMSGAEPSGLKDKMNLKAQGRGRDVADKLDNMFKK
jgi:hypothetical protein